VEGITWWDMSDGGWLNAPAGLLRKNGSSKPAYDELLKLVKGEWWIGPTRFFTDENGKIEFRGFLGDYDLTCEGKQRSFSIPKESAPSIEIRL
jgi:endo-1,4-beta-xylanase